MLWHEKCFEETIFLLHNQILTRKEKEVIFFKYQFETIHLILNKHILQIDFDAILVMAMTLAWFHHYRNRWIAYKKHIIILTFIDNWVKQEIADIKKWNIQKLIKEASQDAIGYLPAIFCALE